MEIGILWLQSVPSGRGFSVCQLGTIRILHTAGGRSFSNDTGGIDVETKIPNPSNRKQVIDDACPR